MSFRYKILIFAVLLIAGATFLILKGNWPLDKVGDTYTGINIPNDQADNPERAQGAPDSLEFAVYDQPRALPDVRFYGPGDQTFSFDNWAGRKLLVNFWATWCAPCVEELPRLNLLQQELRGQGSNIDVITVSMDSQKDFDEIMDFLKKHQAGGLTPYMDSGRDIMKKFNLSGFPVTYILNEQGLEITRYEGPLAWDDPKVLEALLRL